MSQKYPDTIKNFQIQIFDPRYTMEIEAPKQKTRLRIPTPRRWAVVFLHTSGMSFRQIEEEGICTRSSAADIWSKYMLTGHVKDRPKKGRPKATNAREERALMRYALKNPQESTRELAKLDFANKTISKSTINRILVRNDVRAYRPTKKTDITEVNRKKRYDWAMERIDWTIEDWMSVIFSDESMVTNILPRKFIRKRISDPKIYQTNTSRGSYPIKVHVWGAISFLRVGRLFPIEETLTSKKYTDILNDHLIPSFDGLTTGALLFQQDNAPVHAARDTRTFLREKGIQTIEWPPQSPDLNPIENVWAFLKAKIHKDTKNETDLYKELLKIWSKIPDEFLYNLYNSMHERIIEVIAYRGGPTSF
jgi:hypothetical protein